MIKGVKISNAFSDNIVMRLDKPFTTFLSNIETGGVVEQGPFYLYGIEGLDPGEANINSTENTILDGGSFNSSRRPSKELVFTVILNETKPMYESLNGAAPSTIQYAKEKIRQYFPITEKIDILFAEDNYNSATPTKKYAFYKCSGYVKNITYDTFAKMCASRITVSMLDPYFYFVSTETALDMLTNMTSVINILPNISNYQLMPDSNYESAVTNHEPPAIDSKEISLANLNYSDGSKIYYNAEIRIANDISASDLTNTPIGKIYLFDTLRGGVNAPWSKDNNYIVVNLKKLLNYAEFKTRGLKGNNYTHGVVVYNSGASLRMSITDFNALLAATGYPSQRTEHFTYRVISGVGKWYYGSTEITEEELRWKYGLTITSSPTSGDYNYWGIYKSNNDGDIITLSSEPGKRDLGIRYKDNNNDIVDMSITGILEVPIGKNGDKWPFIDKNKNNVYGSIAGFTNNQINMACAISYQIGPVFISFYSKRSGL